MGSRPPMRSPVKQPPYVYECTPSVKAAASPGGAGAASAGELSWIRMCETWNKILRYGLPRPEKQTTIFLRTKNSASMAAPLARRVCRPYYNRWENLCRALSANVAEVAETNDGNNRYVNP